MGGDIGAQFGEGEEEGGIDLRRYGAALLRHKWLIVALAVVGFGAGYGLSRLIKPAYETHATVQIDRPGRNGEMASPIEAGSLLQSRGWIELVRSFRVLDEVVRRRQLYLQPAFPADSQYLHNFVLAEQFTAGSYLLRVEPDGTTYSLRTAEGQILEQGAVGDSIGRGVGFAWQPTTLRPGLELRFQIITPRDAAVVLSRQLDITPPGPEGALLRMGMRGTDPVAITGTLNAVADRFVEVATQLKREKLTALTEVLERQLARSMTDLRTKEESLERFRVGTITLPNDRGTSAPVAAGIQETRDPVFGAFFQMRRDREALVHDRDAMLRALRAPADTANDLVVSLGTIPTVRQSPDLLAALTDLGVKRSEARRLAINYTPEYPPLRELLDEIDQIEQKLVRAQSTAMIANLDQRIGDLDRRIATSSREMQQIPPRASEESRRTRDVEIATTIYRQLQGAYEEAKLAELSAAPDVRILDRADVPTTPLSDQILLVIAGGFLGGAALGIGLALLLDRVDRRIRYPEQVTKTLGLTILGAIPQVDPKASPKKRMEAQAHLVEALRSIRMSLTYAHGTAGTFLTTITSPGPGEGKSFLASHLGRAFADAGFKTLVVDGDSRRGELHRALNVQRKPGLLDFLMGQATLEQVTHRVAGGFDLIPCGTRRAGGPELLASSTMAQLLMELRTKYSVILVDSPPLGAGVDSLALASLCGSMVLVLRTGVTDGDLAEAKMEYLHRLPIRVLGAVMNDVQPTGAYRYYSYLPGYAAEDEVTPLPEPRSGPSARRALTGKPGK